MASQIARDKYATGTFSTAARDSLQRLQEFYTVFSRTNPGQKTRKRQSATHMRVEISPVGEILIYWDFGSGWQSDRKRAHFDHYPMTSRKLAMGYQLKDWLTALMPESWSFSRVKPGDTVTYGETTLDLYMARFWYEKFLDRNLESRFPESFLDEVIGCPMDPISQAEVQMLLEEIKTLVAKKSSDIRQMRREVRDKISQIERENNNLIATRREQCKVDYDNLVAKVHVLAPGYKVTSIDDLSENEW